MSDVLIVTPVYNDWAAFSTLLSEIDANALQLHSNIDVVAIDDGSTEAPLQLSPLPPLKHVRGVAVMHLVCNLGNQRAIAIGLAHAHHANSHDLVLILDSDGEDQPHELASLIEAQRAHPDRIIVGRRARRSEGVKFTIFYFLYKALFRVLIGQRIDFGNFCVIPRRYVARLAHMPELWSHLPATILRSRLPVGRVKTERGQRYAGRSGMNLVSLIQHGLSAMAVFSDVLFVRALAASSAVVILGLAVAGVATALRLFTDLAIPGWATTAVGVALVLILQGVVLSATATFTTLANRANLLFVPAVNGRTFIDRVTTLK